MQRKIDLIYCANGNKRFAEIAINNGFLYGAQLPGKTYFDIYFADQDWKKPNLQKYVSELKTKRPYMATVLDWERWSQYTEVMGWAEEIAPLVEEILIIPKIPGSVESIPTKISGKTVRLAYSVPTRYGGTTVPPREMGLRPVHLLGGSPHAQMEYYGRIQNVVSADGNYHQKTAIMNLVWVSGKTKRGKLGSFTRLEHYMGEKIETDTIYMAFDLSCKNIVEAWSGLDDI